MTIEEFFKEKASNLELTQTERDRVSQKHNDLRSKLRERLSVEDDFLTGSYARRTIIQPKGDEKFDVDFFLAFSMEEYGERELPYLLQLVKNALDAIKAEDEKIGDIVEQRRSIAVVYNDGFQIDVVPAIQIEKDKKYKIFDKKSQKAVDSNPKLHGTNLTNANEATASDSVKRMVPIVKLLKGWKREKCDYMKSFHLELLAVEILKDEEITSFSSGIEKFFNQVGGLLNGAPLKDPANEDNIIDVYLDEDSTRQELLDLVEKEKGIANSAAEMEGQGKENDAIKEWKKIFEQERNNVNAAAATVAVGPTFINRKPSKPWCNV